MKIDFSTAYLIFASVHVLAPLALLIVLWQYRDRQTNWWCYGSILSGLGLILVSARGHIPDFISYQFAQTIVIFGAFSRIWALRYEFPIRKSYLPWMYLVIYSLYILGFHFIVELEVNSRTRLIYTNIFYTYAILDFIYVNYKLKKLHPSRLSFSIFMYSAIFQLFSFVYATAHLTQEQKTGFSFTYTTYHYVLLISILILTIFGNYAFLRLKVEKIFAKYTEDQVALAKQLTSQQEATKHSMERERLMSRLNKTTRASTLGMFASAIAHELNQPLASIRLNAQMLSRLNSSNTMNPASAQEAINHIVTDNQRASDIISTLRSLLIEGEGENTTIDLNALTREIISSSNLNQYKAKITLHVDLPHEEILIFGNKTQLQLAILNLINNAVDALKEHTGQCQIHIYSKVTSPTQCELYVEDTGRGIAAEQMNHLFEAFSTSKKYGMGVGLAISQSIASNHFGVIKAENIPGSGARFTLRLPQAGKGIEFFKKGDSTESPSV